MSLFGSIMGDFEDDPIFGSHMQSMQHMSSMMNSMFDPFGIMGQSQMMGLNGHAAQQQQLQLQQHQQQHQQQLQLHQQQHQQLHQQQHQQQLQLHQQQNQMMPFGFPMAPFGMNDMFAGFNNMASAGGSHGMSSVSMMSYTSNGPDGRPQVYQASKTLRAAPGGIKETQETVYDSRSGTKKMAIGHHIGERGHVIEKQKNLHNGDEEEHQEYINLDEEEADDFNKEWQTRTRQSSHSSHAGTDRAIDYHQHHRKRSDPKRLALTDGTTSRSRLAPSTSRRNASKPSSSSSSTTYDVGDSSSPSTSDSDVVEVPHGEKRSKSPETSPVASRKRERNDDDETSNKRHMTADKDSDDNDDNDDNDDDDNKE